MLVTADRFTFAGMVAALYGDPEDPEFASSDPWVPTLAEVKEALDTALGAGNMGAVVLLAEEWCRLRGGPFNGTTPGFCYGSKTGLWRLQ